MTSLLTSTRTEYNNKILKLLTKYLERYPDLRFNQAVAGLCMLPDSDCFYEEPDVTYKRMLVKYKELFGDTYEQV